MNRTECLLDTLRVDSRVLDMGAPIVYSNGDQVVRIYSTQGRAGELHQLCYYQDGKRQRKTFVSLQEAKRAAKILLGQLVSDSFGAEAVSPAELQSYCAAKQKLESSGVSFFEAADIISKARLILGFDGQQASLLEACEFYRKHHAGNIEHLSIGELAERFMESRERMRLSAMYLKQCRAGLKPFVERFGAKQKDLPGIREMTDWLEKRFPHPISCNAYIRVLKALGNWATRQRYLAINPFTDLQFYKVPATAVEIYTPEEMLTILSKTPKLMIPFVAIGAFAGLRTAEISRLDWKEINLERSFITVAAEKAKTAARRIVPISENLKSWLLPQARDEGRVLPYELTYAMKFLRKPGMPRKKNALRHSYISYRLAQIHDTARVALECGNSPDIIFRHYRELVSPEDAEKWFSIKPD